MVAPTGRQLSQQVIHFLRKTISYADGQSAIITVGRLPAGAVVLAPMSGVCVTTVFNDATNKLVKIGVTGDDDIFDASASVATAGFVPTHEANVFLIGSADIDVLCTHMRTGTAATAGAAEVVIAYIPDTDG
jgi:hypothetical protein